MAKHRLGEGDFTPGVKVIVTEIEPSYIPPSASMNPDAVVPGRDDT